jgi:hypothetical protein
MITSDLKVLLKRKLKRRIEISELNQIASEMGKSRPLQSRSSGGTSYHWSEEEIQTVISKLNNN